MSDKEIGREVNGRKTIIEEKSRKLGIQTKE